ncbi:ferredoxin [Actinomadura roseirufa]|uniref:ferredoxin n=1 Tax=Actinomadura roseirufa TaxID=2094049 RepID=UPI001040F799|nr:ferredoxin [Actinomadura roseirufa]
MRVTIDPVRCIGAGQCVLSAPEVFDQDDEGVVTLREERPDPAVGDVVREAAARCPVEAIGVETIGRGD